MRESEKVRERERKRKRKCVCVKGRKRKRKRKKEKVCECVDGWRCGRMNGDGCVNDCERKMNGRGRKRMVDKRKNDWQILRRKN